MAIKATYIDHCGSDLTTVNAARVSFGKKSEAVEWGWLDIEDRSGELVAILDERDTKLIKYLADHKHYSPFGHCFASFHIKAPIFVARQLVKHEYLRMNEISRRYVTSEPEFYTPPTLRKAAADKKQGSSDELVEGYVGIDWSLMLSIYKEFLEVGVAPEQARMVLPQATMTEWIWSGSLDAFANMCNLRLKEDTQYETRLVAQQIDKVMGKLYPVSWKALVHNG